MKIHNVKSSHNKDVLHKLKSNLDSNGEEFSKNSSGKSDNFSKIICI